MTALIGFELQKVWRKGNFLSLMVLLLLLNVFLLWYVNRPAGDEPPLSAYKAVCQDISDMTEQEKFAYISDLKERADGSGDSLIYTDSPEKECTLIDELYEEISAVSGYDDYLASVQKNSSQLDGISIFRSPTSEENFGSRNIAKSAADHAGLLVPVERDDNGSGKPGNRPAASSLRLSFHWPAHNRGKGKGAVCCYSFHQTRIMGGYGGENCRLADP